MLIFDRRHLGAILADYETHSTGGPIAAASSARHRPIILSIKAASHASV